jgi:membrane protein DedA with SNARE-associated domain
MFTAALSSIGYALGGSWHKAVKDFSDVGYVALALAVIVIALGIYHRIRVQREERATGIASSTQQSLAADDGGGSPLAP